MVETEEISYKALRKVQQGEAGTAALTRLQPDFFRSMAAYLLNLEQAATQERQPQKAKLFAEELANTRKVAAGIYELREKKIVLAALATARGGSPDVAHLSAEEHPLYDSLVQTITEARTAILSASPNASPRAPVPPPPSPKPQTPQQPVPQPAPVPSSPSYLVTQDIPEFVGPDMRVYSLRKDDVVTVPVDIATPLLKQGMLSLVSPGTA